MSTGKLEKLKLVSSLTAGMMVLSPTGNSNNLVYSMAALSVATAITLFFSLLLVHFSRQLPASVAGGFVRASSVGLAAFLALFWCFLTGDRSRLG